MSPSPPSLVPAARRMVTCLLNETMLARLGALDDLSAAADEKNVAFQNFTDACAGRGNAAPSTEAERVELRRVLAAADENAIILEAVSCTLRDLSRKLRAAAATMADPGTYAPSRGTARRPARHVMSACINARV